MTQESTQEVNAAASGQFKIGGDLQVNRLGFGAMRITGKGIWGEPDDREEALRVLKRLPELGVDFIDTADSYGPYVSEDLIAQALAPYSNTVVATKGALTRHGPDIWMPVGRPEYLRQCVLMSLRRLKLDQIPLWQLHRIDAKVPQDEQFGVMKQMQQEGLIRHLGLSEVSVDEIKAAQKVFEVTTVQNLYNLVTRQSEDVLDYCESQNIGFIPWFPLAAGNLARPGSLLDDLSHKYESTASGIALAWVLKRSPVMLPIPGTSKVKHLEENVAAASIQLEDADFAALSEQGKQEEARAKAEQAAKR
ncbi:aldo/keto reductase [Deinococcus ruber]|uniref:Oxidoreductase n=1 Tax=Deinococcus ruber TaxID=1848197 RepID=A0A918C2Y9_9DEIO|nr:aldo/keto reductase [Deinococcus ruber]GGR02128.1 oxidoreductase [Deinococcus ruber]